MNEESARTQTQTQAHRQPLQQGSENSATGEGHVLQVGWREWVALPSLGLPAIKAKIDTGARTSALHAFDIVESTDENGTTYVEFTTQPIQRDESVQVRCRAPLVEKRSVTDSGGHVAERYIVSVSLRIADREQDVELSLTDRRGMLFRMLVGRTSLVPNVSIDPSQSFVLGRENVRDHYQDVDQGKAR